MLDGILSMNANKSKAVRKGLTFSLSLILHAALIAAVIVVPLLRAEASLPGFKVITAALIAPPVLPGVPPGRSGRGGNGPGGPAKGPKEPPRVSGPSKFLAPVEVPTEIVDEDLTDRVPVGTDGPGVEDGAGDGNRPWIIGDELHTRRGRWPRGWP